jgi:hypothetical protein
MERTLAENGVEDEDGEFEKLGVRVKEWYVPTVHLFFNDDLTAA